MPHGRLLQSCVRFCLALSLGLLLTWSLLTSLILADAADDSLLPESANHQEAPEKQGQKITIYWLIFDTAIPAEETLPQLLEKLVELKAEGAIVTFDPQPHRNGPNAVPGIRIIASSEAVSQLRQLPGVLTIAGQLPPPPPDIGRLGLLGTTGTITGRVTDATTGGAVANQAIRLYDAVSFASIGGTFTDLGGFYQIISSTAPYSQVKVLFGDPSTFSNDQYLPNWYNDKAYFSEADAIAFSGLVTGINASLDLGGTISGTAAFEDGGPASFIDIDVYDLDGALVGDGDADDNGHFLIGGLEAGSYKLSFDGGQALGEEWYQDQTSLANATPVNVTAGMTETITAVLTRGGVITGTLTNITTSDPVRFASVYAFDPSGNLVGFGSSNFNGHYEIGGLETGNYKVVFGAVPIVGFGPKYEKQYYNNQSTFAAATTVPVTVGMVIPDLNASLIETGTGVITGMLTKNGAPLALDESGVIDIRDAEVEAIRDFALFLPGDGTTSVYTILNVKAGQYKIEFSAFGNTFFVNEFFDDKPDFEMADPITVSVGLTTTNINGDLTATVEMDNFGSITGTLTNNGRPVQGTVYVQAYRPEDSFYAERDTFIEVADNGVYQIDDLEAGTYLVSFSQFPSATTWYDGETGRGEADLVTVVTGTTTANIDGTLDALGACISGKIVGGDGQGVRNAGFEVYDAADNRIYFWEGLFGTSFTRSGDADEDGGYVACGLSAGTYTIKLDDGGQSNPIAVITGQVVSDFDITVMTERPIYLPLILK